MSEKNEIQHLLQEMKESGWKENRKALWSYFFFAVKRGNLYYASEEIKEYQYKIHPIYEDKQEKAVYWLRVDKEESLNRDTLLDKITQLEELADDFNIFYDHFECEF